MTKTRRKPKAEMSVKRRNQHSPGVFDVRQEIKTLKDRLNAYEDRITAQEDRLAMLERWYAEVQAQGERRAAAKERSRSAEQKAQDDEAAEAAQAAQEAEYEANRMAEAKEAEKRLHDPLWQHYTKLTKLEHEHIGIGAFKAPLAYFNIFRGGSNPYGGLLHWTGGKEELTEGEIEYIGVRNSRFRCAGIILRADGNFYWERSGKRMTQSEADFYINPKPDTIPKGAGQSNAEALGVDLKEVGKMREPGQDWFDQKPEAPASLHEYNPDDAANEV